MPTASVSTNVQGCKGFGKKLLARTMEQGNVAHCRTVLNISSFFTVTDADKITMPDDTFTLQIRLAAQ